MRPRQNKLPADQARLVLETMIELGGRHIKFSDVCETLGTEDTTHYREGLNLLLSENKIAKFGEKRGAKYSVCDGVSHTTVNDKGESVNVEVSSTFATPDECLVSIVSNGTGQTYMELVGELAAQFPGERDYHFKMIENAVKSGKITYNFEWKRRVGFFQNYFYPAGWGKNKMISRDDCSAGLYKPQVDQKGSADHEEIQE